MVSFEVAYEIALSLDSTINSCNEYKDAYHFYEYTDYEVDGNDGPVILKESGKAINFIAFIMNYHPETTPKKLVIPGRRNKKSDQ